MLLNARHPRLVWAAWAIALGRKIKNSRDASNWGSRAGLDWEEESIQHTLNIWLQASVIGIYPSPFISYGWKGE